MLQPTRVFNHEITSQNQLRWLSGYCFRRTRAVLGALASCGHKEPDPRVDELWPSTDEGEARSITIPTSEFQSRLDSALDTLQANAILHVCSAFEASLDGMYAVALLHRPTTADPSWTGGSVPQVLPSGPDLQALLAFVMVQVENDPGRLKGKYSKRLDKISTMFSLAPPPNGTHLDAYYSTRNTIAHDQGLVRSDDPLLSYPQVIKSRVSLPITDWKTMLQRFRECIAHLDKEFIANIIPDSGFALAVHQACGAHVPLNMGQLRQRLSEDWGLERPLTEVEQAAISLGFKVSTEKAPFRRMVRR